MIRQRLKQFINNHTRLPKDKAHHTKLDLSGKKRSAWQQFQAYSHLYYEQKGLACIIKTQYENYLAELPVDTKVENLFAFRNRRLREMLEAESDEVKARVEEIRQKGITVKDEEALEKMLDKGMSEDEYYKMKRKM